MTLTQSEKMVEEVLELIASRATRALPKNYKDVSLLDLGYDSLAAVELQMDVEVFIGRPLGPDDIAGREGLRLTVGTLLERVFIATSERP